MHALKTIHLKDYVPPPHLVDQVEMRVELHPTATRVETRLWLRQNPAAAPVAQLRLDGRQLELLEIALDDVPLAAADYLQDDEGLTIPGVRGYSMGAGSGAGCSTWSGCGASHKTARHCSRLPN